MASLIRDPDGSFRIEVVIPSGSRKRVRLGKVPVKTAESWHRRVEALVSDLTTGEAHGRDLAAWLADLPDKLHKRLVRAGLAESRVTRDQAAVTLEKLCEAFRARASTKPSTQKGYRQTIDSLTRFMGATRPIASITQEDADAWRQWIATDTRGETSRKKKRTTADNRLAPASVGKRVAVAKRIFNKAVEWGWIEKNPMGKLRVGAQSNPARAFYVDMATTEALIDAAPGIQWRTLIGLTRLAGLRCPSEVGLLRWGDVDAENGRLMVRSPKTEHHDGHSTRFVPISPRLRSLLADAFTVAKEREELVVPMAASAAKNLRTTFTKIITRAGRKPWPRRFQNLRASIECDWVEEFPAHVVAAWLGHSVRIQTKHYVQVRDSHFRAVIEGGAKSGAVNADHGGSGLVSVSAPIDESLGNCVNPAVVYGGIVAEAGIEPARGLLPTGF